MENWQKITLGILLFFIGLSLYRPISDLFVNKQGAGVEFQTSSINGTLNGNVREFNVSGSNYMYSPGLMRAKKGETIKIIFHNIEGLHDFKIDQLKVASQLLEENDTHTVTFTASEAGAFEYYCSVTNHKALGMVGKITIE